MVHPINININYKYIVPIEKYKLKRNISFNIKNKNNVFETRLIVWDPYIINYDIKELYNNYSTNYSKYKFNNLINNSYELTKYQRSILIGIILSDGWIKVSKNNPYWNYKIQLKQSLINSQYIWFVWFILGNIISGLPKYQISSLMGKLFYSLTISTRSLKCITNLVNKLFFNNSNKYIKSINEELYHYFDIVVLAHIIIGDGSIKNKGVTICTDCFNYKEVVILINILKIKFDLNCTIHFDKHKPFGGLKLIKSTELIKQNKLGNPRIYIPKNELIKIKSQLIPFMCLHFYYKINYK